MHFEPKCTVAEVSGTEATVKSGCVGGRTGGPVVVLNHADGTRYVEGLEPSQPELEGDLYVGRER